MDSETGVRPSPWSVDDDDDDDDITQVRSRYDRPMCEMFTTHWRPHQWGSRRLAMSGGTKFISADTVK